MPLPHRHYKIARTETRCHLLLKIRQMATQTSASRDYVLFSSGKSATRKFLNCLMICGHSPRSAPNLERHGFIEDANIRLVRNSTFFEPNFRLHFHMKSRSVFLIILLIKATHDMLIASVTGAVPAPASRAPPSHIPGCCGKYLFSPLPSAAARPSPGFRAPAIHPAPGCAL